MSQFGHYLFVYFLGMGSLGAIWGFWPKIKAEVAVVETEAKAAVVAEVAKL
jgi:hypothetical protein